MFIIVCDPVPPLDIINRRYPSFFFCRHHLPSLDIIYPHYTLFAFAKHHLLLLHVIDHRSTSFSVFTCYLPSLYVFTFTRNHLSTAHIFLSLDIIHSHQTTSRHSAKFTFTSICRFYLVNQHQRTHSPRMKATSSCVFMVNSI